MDPQTKARPEFSHPPILSPPQFAPPLILRKSYPVLRDSIPMRYLLACILCLSAGGCCLNRAEGEIVIGGPIEQSVQDLPTAAMDGFLSSWELAALDVYGPDLRFCRLFLVAETARFASGRLGMMMSGSPVMQWSLILHTIDDGRTALWDFLRWLNS
jgi:hypothetical protein